MIEPNKFGSDAAINARINQEDPWVMYLIVNETLNMGVGKVAAQCGHAVGMILNEYYRLIVKYSSNLYEDDSYNIEIKKVDDTEYWLKNSFRKIVKRADLKEWEKLKAIPDHYCFVVQDAGLTEVDQGSETVMVFWPMLKSQTPKEIHKLQLLK